MIRFAVLIACVATTTVARASGDGEPPSVAQARKLYESGKTHYNLSEYREALDAFRAAYRARQDPAILFNVAQCYRMLADFEAAARYYRTYKREMPQAADSSAVVRLIAEMDKAAQERTARQPPTGTKQPGETHAAAQPPAVAVTAPTAAATPSVPPTTAVVTVERNALARSRSPTDRGTRGRAKVLAGATLVGVGAAALIIAIVEGVLASKASDDVNAAARAMQPFDPSKQATGQTDQVVSAALYGFGAAAVVTGTVLAVIGRREHARAPTTTLTPHIGPRYAGATLETRF